LPVLAREEGARADPEFREGFEICLVSAGDGVFLSALDPKAIFSRRKRPDFFYKRGVHEHRPVDANESVGFEFFCHHRNRLTQQVGTRVLLEPNAFTFSLNGNHVAQTDKQNLSPDFDGHPERLWLRWRLPPRESLHRSRCLFSRIACFDQGCTRVLRHALNERIARAFWTRDSMSRWSQLQSVHRSVLHYWRSRSI